MKTTMKDTPIQNESGRRIEKVLSEIRESLQLVVTTHSMKSENKK